MNRCPVCGKEIVSPWPTIVSKDSACSLHCAELYKEIHELETRLRRLKVEAADRKASQRLYEQMRSILQLYETVDGESYLTPVSYQELQALKKSIIHILQVPDDE